MMDSKELRQKFLEFFEEKEHKILPAASLIPKDDHSVLFTTAGMQQFKKYYADPSVAPAVKVATCQPCVRTSDIDEVGDETHLTFFEMLGNFSFNDYFKKETIELAWEFLTEVLKVDKSRIHATYFEGNEIAPADEESFTILKTIDGLEKIEPQGFEDNFWSLGTENSPGGPTVEFYIDGIEIWNLVFNEYVFKNGKYEKSKFRGVDTGMGLERMLAVINNFDNVYKTDLLAPIVTSIDADDKNKRIIADHIKTAVFIINDGVVPANKDQGYIVRRLIRRAMVKSKDVDLIKLAEDVFELYDGVYKFDRETIKSEIDKEISKFNNGLNKFDEYYSRYLSKQGQDHIAPVIGGKFAFDMFQSYGFPLEVTLDEFRKRNMLVNEPAIKQDFNQLLKAHQEQSRTASAGMFKGGLTTQSEQATKYHTATHLLLAALRQVLGPDVHQKGSNITDERLRFDFSWPEKMTDEQIKKVEDLVNEKIEADLQVSMSEMKLEDARNCGVVGEFNEKYGDIVKVYAVGDFSKELCGGPHVETTGSLGHFKIQKEESSSAGIRRIKAVLE
jgi:alanyl-tRNA synthetase